MNYPGGWIHPDDRTYEQHQAHQAAMHKMPQFFIKGGPLTTPAVGTKILLTDTWKHPAVVAALGKPFTGWHQFTGSCVGAGGGNALATLAFTDVLLRGDRENIILPFWPLNYGMSRYDEGDRGQGEGSMGSTFAQSCKEDGVLDCATAGLPAYDAHDGFCWGPTDSAAQHVEMTWSDGAAISSTWLTQSRKHLVHTTSPLNSAADIRDAICNGYPVTMAGIDWTQPGTESLQGTGSDQVVIGPCSTGRGGHQQSIQGYWNHATYGELFLRMNQWGINTYKADPSLGFGGGVWNKFNEIDQRAKNRDWEIYALSQFDGYPAQVPNVNPW